MSDINRSNAILRSAITQSLDAINGMRTHLCDLQRQLHNNPVNAPVEAATTMLGKFGFCVVHRVQLDKAIDCLESLVKEDHDHAESEELLFDLLGYLKSQRQFAD
jgi:predicted site-specific integrase-resolvase